MLKIRFPIHHTFGPLVTTSQWKMALRMQFHPWMWRSGAKVEELRSELTQSFGMSVSLFSSGRDALLAVLRALELSAGDEVILQGYTCCVVPNAIHVAQATPVYVDADPQTLNIDLNKLQRLITPRTKAIICQHTFGIPADTERLRAICDKRGLALIEDSAHCIPDAGSDAQLSMLQSTSASDGIGAYGDAVIFSFGRDKAISGVTGGAALTKHRVLARKLADMERGADYLSYWHIGNLVAYPVRYAFAKWLWRLPNLGIQAGSRIAKAYLQWAKVMGLLPPVITNAEKAGKSSPLLHKLPNACAALALEQLRDINQLNDHRRSLFTLYNEAAKKNDWSVPSGILLSCAPLKFPIYARNAQEIRDRLKMELIYLDDGWCNAAVCPSSADQEAMGYAQGTCPVSEDIAKHILNLPMHPTMSAQQATYLVHALGSYVG